MHNEPKDFAQAEVQMQLAQAQKVADRIRAVGHRKAYKEFFGRDMVQAPKVKLNLRKIRQKHNKAAKAARRKNRP